MPSTAWCILLVRLPEFMSPKHQQAVQQTRLWLFNRLNQGHMGKWINNHRGYSVSDLSDEIFEKTLQLKASLQSVWKDPNHTGAKTNSTLGGIIS